MAEFGGYGWFVKVRAIVKFSLYPRKSGSV